MQSPSQEAWNRLRSLIKRCLTFAELKDAAGSAGLEVERLAHLQQKSLPERGASKSELLDGIGTLFAARSEPDRIEILEIFVRECLREFPGREGEFGNALRRSGIILTEKQALYVYASDEPKPAVNPVTRKPDCASPLTPSAAAPLVFVSYSHADTAFKIQLEKHLKALSFEGKLSFWTDDQISPGAVWFQEMKWAIDSAIVAVLLVTGDFLASDFIREHEFQPILQRHNALNLKLIWVPVRACNWRETPLQDIQTPISPDKPIAEMKAERDKAWVKVCQAIKQAAEFPVQSKPLAEPPRLIASSTPKQNPAVPRSTSPGERLDLVLTDLHRLRGKIASCDDDPPLDEVVHAVGEARCEVFNCARSFSEAFDAAKEKPQPAKLPGLAENCPPGKWALRPDLWPMWDLVNAVIGEITRIRQHPSFEESEREWLRRIRPFSS